jgi:hypothetical protein
MPTKEVQNILDRLQPFMDRYAVVLYNRKNNAPLATLDHNGMMEFHDQSPIDMSEALSGLVEAYVEFVESLSK